jgi:hypothetical protein
MQQIAPNHSFNLPKLFFAFGDHDPGNRHLPERNKVRKLLQVLILLPVTVSNLGITCINILEGPN